MKPIAPLALLFLAAALDPDVYDLRMVDEQIEDDPPGHLRAVAADALAMGITAMSEYQL